MKRHLWVSILVACAAALVSCVGDKGDIKPPLNTSCSANADCKTGLTCQGGQCVTPEVVAPPKCTKDADCGTGEVCDGGDCVKPEAPPAEDATAPEVSVTVPKEGSTIKFKDSVSVAAEVKDDIGVVSVQFKLDGQDLGPEVTAAPFKYDWTINEPITGPHKLTAVAKDGTDKTTESAAVNVIVIDGDIWPVQVYKAGPKGGQPVDWLYTIEPNLGKDAEVLKQYEAVKVIEPFYAFASAMPERGIIPVNRWSKGDLKHFFTIDTSSVDGWTRESDRDFYTYQYPAPNNMSEPVYRLCNLRDPDYVHYYTSDLAERDMLMSKQYYYEGAWYAPMLTPKLLTNQAVPIYRCASYTGPRQQPLTHFYTASKSEIDAALASNAWVKDPAAPSNMIAFYAYNAPVDSTSRPVYRLYNPGPKINDHLYVLDPAKERLNGYIDEGIAFYTESDSVVGQSIYRFDSEANADHIYSASSRVPAGYKAYNDGKPVFKVHKRFGNFLLNPLN